jgi:hypothetical protein
MARSYDHGRQHSVIIFGLVVGPLARKTLRATQFLQAKIFRAIQRYQRPVAQPSKCLQTVALPQLLDASLHIRPRERRVFWMRCMVCGRAGSFVDPFPRTSSRR